MSITECTLCFERYDSEVRIPKNTGCGHVYCLSCLKEHKKSSGLLKCPVCVRLIVRQPEELETNFTILSEASSTPKNQFFCTTCGDEAKTTCPRNNHSLKDLVAHRTQQTELARKMVGDYANLLDEALLKVLDFGEVANGVGMDIRFQQQKAAELALQLGAPVSGSLAQDAEAIRAASDLSLQQAGLERGLQLLGLDKGVLNLKLQGAQGEGADAAAGAAAGPWVSSVNLEAIADEAQRREVLVAARVFFYLLHKHGHLQQNVRKMGKPHTPTPHAGTGKRPGVQKCAQAGGGPGLLGQGDFKASAGDCASEMVKDGVLDLRMNGIGEAPSGQKGPEKAALLRSSIPVTHIMGLKCDEDPTFSTKLIMKHSAYLKDLEIKQVKPEHIPLLGLLRGLTNLKVVGCVGHLPRLPPQQSCVLRSLYMTLPFKVQLGLWESYAASVSNVVLRVRLHESVDVHLSISKVANKSPMLANLHLHRTAKDNHMDEECSRQVAAVRSVLPPHVRVSCNMCSAGRD